VAISAKSMKLLWANAGGRCSFAGCEERLCGSAAGQAAPYTLGEMAHIKGDKQGSNRHDPDQPASERDDYANLILLCPTHHTLIDKPENETEFPSEALYEMKALHEASVAKRLDKTETPSKEAVAKEIAILLEQCKQSWAKFGPLSELARNNPHSEEAHQVWVSERLSIIVPNNRKIQEILDASSGDFETEEQPILASFGTHARSYEMWVRDEIPYAAVEPFPTDFDALIRENASVSK